MDTGWREMMMDNAMYGEERKRCTDYFLPLSLFHALNFIDSLVESLRYDRCKFSILESEVSRRADETRRDETILEIEKKKKNK